jgi:hypothetical protein
MPVMSAAGEAGFRPRHPLFFVPERWSNTLISRCGIRCSVKRHAWPQPTDITCFCTASPTL